jgi:uncharacterized protein (DUF488 family)
MDIYTIGFTKKSAEDFFELLAEAGVGRVVDVRLNNQSQLAGFTKGRDLPYFLERVVGADYLHLVELAPTKELLNAYKKQGMTWFEYEQQYSRLLDERRVGAGPLLQLQTGDCLLCSEPTPDKCHRRVLAEYFQQIQPEVQIHHL